MAFVIAVSLASVVLTLLALPLAGLVGDVLRSLRRRPAPARLSEIEVEHSVRDRLYGERTIEPVGVRRRA